MSQNYEYYGNDEGGRSRVVRIDGDLNVEVKKPDGSWKPSARDFFDIKYKGDWVPIKPVE